MLAASHGESRCPFRGDSGGRVLKGTRQSAGEPRSAEADPEVPSCPFQRTELLAFPSKNGPFLQSLPSARRRRINRRACLCDFQLDAFAPFLVSLDLANPAMAGLIWKRLVPHIPFPDGHEHFTCNENNPMIMVAADD